MPADASDTTTMAAGMRCRRSALQGSQGFPLARNGLANTQSSGFLKSIFRRHLRNASANAGSSGIPALEYLVFTSLGTPVTIALRTRSIRSSQSTSRHCKANSSLQRRPAQELFKAQLTLQIYTILKDSGMTQVEIAKILGVRQPQVSLLMRNRAGNFSVRRLMEFLTALRQDVEITVRPTNKEHGTLSVISA